MDLYKALFDIYTSSETLSEFVKKISIEINNPIALINENFEIIASSDKNLYRDSFWDKSIGQGYWDLDASHYIEEEFKDGKNFKIITGLGEHRRLFIKLVYNDKFVGYCAVLEVTSGLDELNENNEIVRSISILFAKALYDSEPFIETNNEELILLNLLNQKFVSKALFLERLKKTKLKNSKSNKIMLVNISSLDKKEVNNVRNIYKDYISILKDDYLLIFFDEEVEQGLIEKMNSLLFSAKSQAILSKDIIDLYYIHDIYEHLKKLFEKLKTSLNEYKIYFEEDYLLLLPIIDNDNNDLYSYVDDDIRQIYFYDNENKTNFIDTLYIYLLTNNSLIETSKRLYLHRNTITYRLEKMRDNFNIELNNFNKKLTYLNSIIILYYLENSISKIDI